MHTNRAETRSISIAAAPDAVLDFVGDARTLPRWAPDFARSIRPDGEYWVVDAKNGSVRCWGRPPQSSRLHEIPTHEDAASLECATLPGFVLDVTALRAIAQRR